ncbi:MAG: ABC transporter ATP-binding protein [Bacteroidales bacterium]|nr:ABC transporter ATP-binding protein [Bacteroidales bacterium]
MEKKVVIQGKDLCIGYRTGKKVKIVHQHLDFELRAGELTCLLGANGAGKSTLLRTLSASQPSLGGELRMLDKPVSEYTEKERSRTIGVVLTDKTFAGGLSVYELVALGRQPHTGFFGRLTKEDKRIVQEAMENVGIAHKAKNYTAELSDGERQKVMIAKALVQECPLILLDEPTAFLDVVSRIEIMHLLHRLATEQQKAILLSTHDIEQALVLSDKLWLLTKGKGLQCGVTEDIILNHRMDSLFPHKNICFDYDHGVYYPTVIGHRRISVSCEDKTLLHWMMNALNRHGYQCTSTPEEEMPHIKASSAKEMNLNIQGKNIICTSFEELLKQI